MKRIIAGVILLLTPIALHAAETKFPPLTGPVVDAANQITDDKEKILDKELRAFQKESGHQLVVVTVPDLQDKVVSDYAFEFGRHYDIGRKGVDDGIVLLQYPGDGSKGSAKVAIQVGRGMEYILTDAEMSRVIRETMGSIVKQDRPRSETMPEAIVAGAREVMKLGRITKEQKIDFDRKAEEQLRKKKQEAWDSFINFFFVLGIISGGGLLAFMAYYKSNEKKRTIKEKERRERLAAEEEIRRQVEARRREENLRQAAIRKKARDDMLNAMSPQERDSFLRREELARMVEAENQKKARDRARAEEESRLAKMEQERIRQQQEYRREESSSNSSFIVLGGGSYGGSSGSDNSSNDSYSGGGGDFGGGGADGDL